MVQAFCGDVHLGFGGNVNVTVGPIGREASASMCMGKRGYAMVYSYSCSRGAFCGVSVNGTVTNTRASANLAFYGRPLTAKDLLLGGSVDAPPAARSLYNALDSMINSFAYGDLQRPPTQLSLPWFSSSAPLAPMDAPTTDQDDITTAKDSIRAGTSEAVMVPTADSVDPQVGAADMSPASAATAAVDMLDMHESTTGLDSGFHAFDAEAENVAAGSRAATEAGESGDEDDGMYIHDLFD